VDTRALQDPHFKADNYVQSILSDATEGDVRAYVNDLHNVRDQGSTDLQHNVYQNRTQFIRISKEADKLKTEMRTLRTLMSDLTGALGQAAGSAGTDQNGASSSLLSLTTPTASTADRKRANRSSVANLEAMWSSHLQTLWKRAEGSQKFLPALPGRHIILESQRWVELNAATWKPRRRVALVLLNDHLLVASEKKRRDLVQAEGTKGSRQSVMFNSAFGGQASVATQTTFVAERCWALQDVSLADISTSSPQDDPGSNSALANAINIRAGNESLTYATSDNGEKAGLVVAFRKAQEDLRKLMAAEHGERQNQLNDMGLLDADKRSLKKAAAAAGVDIDEKNGGLGSGALSRSNSIMIDVDGRQQSIRWVESQIDTLDIDIALQRFEDAVARVERLRKLARTLRSSNALAASIILAKVDERANGLSGSIARQLVQMSSGMERTRENVSWLLRLGFEEMARMRYLNARTETMRVRTRQLPFTGALPPYLHALAYTTFTLLLHTFKIFGASFPTSSGSSVVRWGKERVDEFNGMLGRQLSSVEEGSALWEECISVVKQRAGVLSEVGVEFRGLVGRDLGKSQGSETTVRSGQANGGRMDTGEAGIGLGVAT